mmetsp:Transcript_63323/g.125227  ORF Transcript_63323/g.125227 Transcript_63323/m.125227 type:complete len:206 (+) Transcript_63323:2173-2790(+)
MLFRQSVNYRVGIPGKRLRFFRSCSFCNAELNHCDIASWRYQHGADVDAEVQLGCAQRSKIKQFAAGVELPPQFHRKIGKAWHLHDLNVVQHFAPAKTSTVATLPCRHVFLREAQWACRTSFLMLAAIARIAAAVRPRFAQRCPDHHRPIVAVVLFRWCRWCTRLKGLCFQYEGKLCGVGHRRKLLFEARTCLIRRHLRCGCEIE